MPHPRLTPIWRLIRAFGLAMVVVYLAWNVWWLSQYRLPPALSLGLLGIPAPTTGMTRSTIALWRGDFATSLVYNPATLILWLLIVVTPVVLTYRAFRIHAVSMPTWLVWSWGITLSMAWGIKLTSPTWTW